MNKEMLNFFSHNFNNKILVATVCVEILCSFKVKSLDWIIEKIFQTYKMLFSNHVFTIGVRTPNNTHFGGGAKLQ